MEERETEDRARNAAASSGAQEKHTQKIFTGLPEAHRIRRTQSRYCVLRVRIFMFLSGGGVCASVTSSHMRNDDIDALGKSM